MDEYLFNEYLYHREYYPRLHLCLGDLPGDRTAIMMTGGFNIVRSHHLVLRLVWTRTMHEWPLVIHW
jgi:hypothetical protein